MKSIREIARLSEVSTATVSRYMNKSGYVSKQTASKIEEVLTTNEYHPNKLTTAIINGRSNDIALIVQNIMNPFFAQLVDEIESLMENTDYNLIICNCNGSSKKEKQHYKNLLEKRIAGLLVINTNDENIYKNKAIPVIGIEKRVLNWPKVSISNEEALKQIFDNVKIADSHVLMIKGQESSYSSNLRAKYFKEFANDHNCTYEVEMITDDLEMIKEALGINYSKYDTVFCWTDIVAHKVYSEIIAQGLSIPQDIQLVGFDGLTINNIFSYNLTTVDQQIRNLGNVALCNLIDSINSKKIDDVYLQCKFKKGNTTR
ncbi:MAG: LacI family DNA-binding transcriptional regulator [Erysipelotrichaceae bacterium]